MKNKRYIRNKEERVQNNEVNCGCICGDERFEIIKSAKKLLIENTNISSSQEEMEALDSLLFRFWQMGWLGTADYMLSVENKDNRDYYNKIQLLDILKDNSGLFKLDEKMYDSLPILVIYYYDHLPIIEYVDEDNWADSIADFSKPECKHYIPFIKITNKEK